MHQELVEQLERLNESQREAVLDESRVCVVNANVGSGKTTVLINKILYLHYEKKISYQDMVVLTFTNKAADEIKERLKLQEPNLDERELGGFGTFHSVALNLLKNELPVESLGYTKDFCVMEPEEELDLARQLIAEEKLNIKYKNRLKKRLEQERIPKYQDELPRLRELLVKEKRRQDKMTFQDLLSTCTELLMQEKEAGKTTGNARAYLIIDEVQDSDKEQLQLLEALMESGTRLFVVGDPNQVIYSWRGSMLNVFYELKTRYQARELSLSVNYRSSQSILEAAKCFKQNGTALTGVRESGDKIVVKRHYNSFQEACYLADKIRELHEAGIPYGEIAIFYRLQSQSEQFVSVFAKNQIPFEVSMKKNVGEIPVLRWLIYLLRALANERDRLALQLVLQDQNYGVRKKEQEEYAEQIRSVAEWLKQVDCMELLPAGMESAGEESAGTESAEMGFAEQLYHKLNLDRNLHPTAATYLEDQKMVKEFLQQMCETLIQVKVTVTPQGESAAENRFLRDHLRDYLNRSALLGSSFLKQEIDEDSDSVKLMTLHAAKGLEFSHVFITGVNYGLIPLQGKGFEEEEEERRLFFVGITRAKNQLELSYYTNPDTFRTVPGESRFLRMIPERLLEREEYEEKKTNLQELKKQVIAEKNRGAQLWEELTDASLFGKSKPQDHADYKSVYDSMFDGLIKSSESGRQKKMRHRKYGTGVVVREDEAMITVEFDGYGEKEFVKAFSELEEV